jgi:hypothetical protein
MATHPALNRDHLIEQAHARGTGRSQATVVEQSRAIAEVQGALIVADRRPRDRQRALAEALESCRTQEVAQHAFFKFPRGGQSVSGPSIHLARELARCWGNVVYSVVELDRDDDRAVSEMMAYAWDLETNTRAQLQFLVPHKRDKRGGAEVLTDMRDIYENNANMGARRLRECIFAVLPPYLTKSAENQCFLTLQQGADDKPLPVRINEAIEAFAKIGIDNKRIEGRLGPVARFTEVDLANMRITYQSIQRGEVRADDEFPKVDALTAQQMIKGATTKPEPTADKPEPKAGSSDRPEPEVEHKPRQRKAAEPTKPEEPFQAILDKIAGAVSEREVDAIDRDTEFDRSFLSQEQCDDLDAALAQRRAELRQAETAGAK